MKKSVKIRNTIIKIVLPIYVAASIFIAFSRTKEHFYDRLPDLPTRDVVNTEWNSGLSVELCNNVEILNDTTALYDTFETSSSYYIMTGWAVDMDRGCALGGLYVAVDGVAIKCDYGYERTDVSDVFFNPNMKDCGFIAVIPKSLLKNNMFEVTDKIEFYMVGADGTYMYNPIAFEKPTGVNE